MKTDLILKLKKKNCFPKLSGQVPLSLALSDNLVSEVAPVLHTWTFTCCYS